MSLLRKRKGVSGIISGVFLVAVTVIIFNVLAWQFFQADAYNRIVRETQQREWERFNEKLVVYLPNTSITRLSFRTRNVGSVTAHIVTLYFSFSNGTRYLYTLDVWVNSGNSRLISDVGPPLIWNDVYYFQVGTERGNLFGPVPEGPGGISNEPPAPGQGQPMPFTFSFLADDLQYKVTQTETPPSPDSDGWSNGWVFTAPAGPQDKVWFKIKLKNTSGADVQMETRCHLNLVYAAKTTGQAFESVAYCSSRNTPLGILNGETTWVVFGYAPKSTWKSGTNDYYMFLALFYHATPVGPTMGATVGIVSIEVSA